MPMMCTDLCIPAFDCMGRTSFKQWTGCLKG